YLALGSAIVSLLFLHFFLFTFFFFLLIRRPPRSTLFPTRRSSDLRSAASAPPPAVPASAIRIWSPCDSMPVTRAGQALRAQRLRSEEHTSELQSLAYLVCRLLLEKKKKKEKMDDNI